MKRCTCGCDTFTAVYREDILGYYVDNGMGLEHVDDGDVIDNHGRRTPFQCNNPECRKKYKTEDDIPDFVPALSYDI